MGGDGWAMGKRRKRANREPARWSWKIYMKVSQITFLVFFAA
jgi:hypothetical protein